MRELSFTFWRTVKSPEGSKLLAFSWHRWLEILIDHKRRPDKDGPCLTLCQIPAGHARKNDNVIGIDGLCLDIDSGTDTEIAQALTLFKKWEYILHSTHSHGQLWAGKRSKKTGEYSEYFTDESGERYRQTKIRAVFPLSQRITSAEHAKLWPVFSSLAMGFNDERTKAVSHPFYLPSAPDGAPTMTFHNAGEWLDPRSLMSRGVAQNMASASGDNHHPTTDTAKVIIDRDASKIRALFQRMAKTNPLKPAATAVTRGEVYAEDGERHNTQRGLTGFLAFKTFARPLCSEAIEEIFRLSTILMQAADPDCDGLEEIIAAYDSAVDNARKAKRSEALHDQRGDGAATHLGIPEVWHRDELLSIAKDQRIGDPKDIRYIVAGKSEWFVLKRDGGWEGPLTEKNTVTKVFQQLAYAPLELYDTTGEAHKRRSLADLMIRYGTVATKSIASLAHQCTTFDLKTGKIREAVCPVRLSDLDTPYFDADFDEYLRVFTPNRVMYDKINDWLACVPDLNKLLCALVLAGEPGTGKTLFAQGVSSLWSDVGAASGPETIIGNFSEDLARCPLVFADETLPRTWKWDSVTTVLRREIGSLARTLTRKYFAPVELHGALRFILATNNAANLLTSKVATPADLKAIAQRFLYVETKLEAEAFLKKQGRKKLDMWRTSGIARHALWLMVNRQVEHTGRFWVMGDVARMHRLLVTSSDWNSHCCEWLVKGLNDNFRKATQRPETAGLVVIRDRKLYVNTNAIIDGWDSYTRYPNIHPDPRHVATSLRSISVSPKPEQLRDADGHRKRYFRIDIQHLVAWAEEHNMGDREEIEAALGRGVRQPPKVVNLKDGSPHEP